MQRSRHFALATAVAIVLVVAAPGSAPAVASTPKSAASSHLQREVFGFALASSLANPSWGFPSWNFDLLSTVAFFGLHVETSGRFAADAGWNTWHSADLTNLVAVAHQHGTTVVLTVILQDFSPNTPNMCAALQHADATVAQTVQEVKAQGVDGVNIDYEGLDGNCGFSDSYWAQHAMTAFAQKMRAGLGSSLYLSVDTYAAAASDGYGFFDVAGLAQYIDSFFVMAYDLEYSNYSRLPASCSSFCLGPTAPLSGYYYNDSAVASQYVAVAGASKVILGVPYYGRKSCVGGVVPNAYPTSSVSADSYLDALSEASDPAVKAGSYATHRDTNSSGGERWDTWYNTTLNCTRELYWDDAVSLGKKYDVVNAFTLRGAGIWNLNYGGGAAELWSALSVHFGGCQSVSATLSPVSPLNAGKSATITGSASGCPHPLYKFWMRPAASSAWQMVQDYSTNPAFHWNSTGAAPGTVYFGVWARDAASTADFDTYGPTQYIVVAPCSSVSASFSPAPPIAIGSGFTVTVSGAAVGCPNPVYEFWMRPASSSAWQMVQGYSTNATYLWNSTGAAGKVYFGVWARDAASTAASDATASAPYTLFSPCSAATESFSPTGSVARGSGATVTITAGATGCPNPRYEFWMRPSGSATWQIVQDYSTSPTYRWNSAGAAAGTEYFGVWVRDAASTAGNDTTASAQYRVVSPCSSVTQTFSPAQAAHGTGATVVITAAASGCANPTYEFWMRPSGSTTWQMVQGYSTSQTYRWNTSGAPAGSDYFGVWVRDAASVATNDAYVSVLYTLT